MIAKLGAMWNMGMGTKTNAAGSTSGWFKGGLLKRERRVAAVLFCHVRDSVFCL